MKREAGEREREREREREGSGRSVEVYAKNYNLLHAARQRQEARKTPLASLVPFTPPPHNLPPFPPLWPLVTELDVELLAAAPCRARNSTAADTR